MQSPTTVLRVRLVVLTWSRKRMSLVVQKRDVERECGRRFCCELSERFRHAGSGLEFAFFFLSFCIYLATSR